MSIFPREYEPDDVAFDAKRRERELERKVLTDAFKSVACSAEGQVVLRWLISQTGVLATYPSLDASKMAFMEGRRSIGLLLLRECGAFGVYDKLLSKPVTEDSDNG